jgi:hypothetical protein
MDPWLRFILAVLATWRVTHLLASEDGPADLIVRFRSRLGRGWVGGLMDCFYCLSLWVAAPAALFITQKPLDWLFTWLALSGAACLLERVGQDPVVIQPMPQTTQGDTDYGMLRSETSGAGERSAGGGHTPSSDDHTNSSGPAGSNFAAPDCGGASSRSEATDTTVAVTVFGCHSLH